MTDPRGAAQPEPTSTGLAPALAALLAYLFGALSGLAFFLMEKRNQEVRFHAAQSLVFSGFAAVVAIAAALLGVALPYRASGVFDSLMVLVWLGFFGVWVALLLAAGRLRHTKLPLLGDLAESMAGAEPRPGGKRRRR